MPGQCVVEASMSLLGGGMALQCRLSTTACNGDSRRQPPGSFEASSPRSETSLARATGPSGSAHHQGLKRLRRLGCGDSQGGASALQDGESPPALQTPLKRLRRLSNAASPKERATRADAEAPRVAVDKRASSVSVGAAADGSAEADDILGSFLRGVLGPVRPKVSKTDAKGSPTAAGAAAEPTPAKTAAAARAKSAAGGVRGSVGAVSSSEHSSSSDSSDSDGDAGVGRAVGEAAAPRKVARGKVVAPAQGLDVQAELRVELDAELQAGIGKASRGGSAAAPLEAKAGPGTRLKAQAAPSSSDSDSSSSSSTSEVTAAQLLRRAKTKKAKAKTEVLPGVRQPPPKRGRVCAKMLVASGLRCPCHFSSRQYCSGPGT
mmetsp:Transcript_56482/g.183532  ORF Transcript_56482/g.183532 Transcript_56482/m.183532 type:complete len:377 (+) Transcript_56482:321-1451(+)